MYSISFDEVRKFVESKPEDTSVVGVTCNSQKCIIAEAVWAKYTSAVWVWVEPGDIAGEHWVRIFLPDLYDGEVHKFNVDTGEDSEKLRDLARGFDRIKDNPWTDKEVTKKEAMEALF